MPALVTPDQFQSPPLRGAVLVSLTSEPSDGWVMLMPSGEFAPSNPADKRGPWRLDEPAAVIANSALPALLDFDHRSLAPAAHQDTAAAGWIVALEARPTGLFGRVEWTPRGTAALAGREYRHISPTFFAAAGGAVRQLQGAALTNLPALTDLPALASTTVEDNQVDKEALKAALGLPPTATQADIDAALVAGRKASDTVTALAAAMGTNADALDIAALSAAVTAKADPPGVPVEQYTALATRLAALEADKGEKRVQALLGAGKLVPGMKSWALALLSSDPAAFAEFEKTAPVVVPRGQAVPSGRAPDGSAAVGLSADQLAIAQQLGLDPAKYAAALVQEGQ
jgi:phage I-like protein